ncbi:VOC family protein [Halorubrum sp. DTA46]|uniref:VOC family protein n=1 Tax=Halorubrum sp. DTA46 TaxID=3402162 RepID=UPI003AAF8735
MFNKIHHIAFVVEDIESSMTSFEENYGMELLTRGEMTAQYKIPQEIDVALYQAGDNIVELIEPLSEEGWTYDVLREQGDGWFHIAFGVDDIREGMAELESRGIRIWDDEPSQGFAWKVVTLEPEDTLVPMQLVEETD